MTYPRSNSFHGRRGTEEDRAWSHLYRNANDPALAEEVVKHLGADRELKNRHIALYLRCKEGVRKGRERQARKERIGDFLAYAISLTVVAPFRALLAGLRFMGGATVEAFPQTHAALSGMPAQPPVEPATSRIKPILEYPDMTGAQEEFNRTPQASTPDKAAGSSRRKPKAA